MKPLLAHIYEPHRVTFPCYVQPKLNGIRALYQNGRFQSRDGIPFPVGLLNHLSKPLLEVFPPDVILDGELYVHGWPLQRINAAVTPVRQQPTEDTGKVEYWIFDVVNFTKSFRERIFWPSVNLPNKRIAPGIHCVQWDMPDEQAVADQFYARVIADGFEGMMYRLGDCPYTVEKQQGCDRFGPNWRTKFLSDKDNRVWHMLKRKNWLDFEFPFVSLNSTTGEKGEPGFQMWLTSQNGKPFKVSSGLTQKEVEGYLENPLVGRLVKVKYLVLSSEGIPLNATILTVL